MKLPTAATVLATVLTAPTNHRHQVHAQEAQANLSIVCPTDQLSCPGTPFAVLRDPFNDCLFFPCPPPGSTTLDDEVVDTVVSTIESAQQQIESANASNNNERAGCTPCTDIPTQNMVKRNYDCTSAIQALAVQCYEDDGWTASKICQYSCYMANRGYEGDECCPGGTGYPTGSPTGSPTGTPTSGPTRRITESPTAVPTKIVTGAPTASPTAGPTAPPVEAAALEGDEKGGKDEDKKKGGKDDKKKDDEEMPAIDAPAFEMGDTEELLGEIQPSQPEVVGVEEIVFQKEDQADAEGVAELKSVEEFVEELIAEDDVEFVADPSAEKAEEEPEEDEQEEEEQEEEEAEDEAEAEAEVETISSDPEQPQPALENVDGTPGPQCGVQADGAECATPGWTGLCCSAWGFCGKTDAYCGAGCQNGSCLDATTSTDGEGDDENEDGEEEDAMMEEDMEMDVEDGETEVEENGGEEIAAMIPEIDEQMDGDEEDEATTEVSEGGISVEEAESITNEAMEAATPDEDEATTLPETDEEMEAEEEEEDPETEGVEGITAVEGEDMIDESMPGEDEDEDIGDMEGTQAFDDAEVIDEEQDTTGTDADDMDNADINADVDINAEDPEIVTETVTALTVPTGDSQDGDVIETVDLLPNTDPGEISKEVSPTASPTPDGAPGVRGSVAMAVEATTSPASAISPYFGGVVAAVAASWALF